MRTITKEQMVKLKSIHDDLEELLRVEGKMCIALAGRKGKIGRYVEEYADCFSIPKEDILNIIENEQVLSNIGERISNLKSGEWYRLWEIEDAELILSVYAKILNWWNNRAIAEKSQLACAVKYMK